MRCFLSSSAHNKRIGSSPDGNVFITDNRQDWERWIISSASDKENIVLKSMAHGRYLKSNADGDLETAIDHEHVDTKWCIRPSSGDKYQIWSAVHDKALYCNQDESAYTANSDNDEKWSEWNVELETGELCFISSLRFHKRIRCEPSGKLNLTDNWKGWEVWRFIEAGKGNVLISSCTHKTRFLCSNPEGNVYTTTNRFGSWEKWSIEKDPASRGIIIKSSDHGKVLKTDGNGLCTSESHDLEEPCGIWCAETACSQVYFISATCHDKRIGTSHHSPFTTTNRKGWEQWKIEKDKNNDCFTISSVAHGQKYLGSSQDGKVLVKSSAGSSELWEIKESLHGGYFLVSKEHLNCLACNDRGHLYTSSKQYGGWETWRLEPVMPSGEEMGMMTAIGIAGGVTIGLMISAPFIAMGAIGAIGFTEGGIAAGSVAAGMMSAEAIAAGGGVAAGGTVAALQSIGVLGLGLGGTSAAVGAGALAGGVIGSTVVGGTRAVLGSGDALKKGSVDQTKVPLNKNICRPLCDWRIWN